MEYVTHPSLGRIVKRRRARVAAALGAVLCLLVLAGQRGPAGPSATVATVAVPIEVASPVVLRHDVATPGPRVDAGLTLLEASIEFIERFEGRRHRVYRDTRGNMTVGVGFNLDRAGAARDLKDLLPGVGYRALRRGDQSLTDVQIDVLLEHDARRAIDTARRQVEGFDTLPVLAQLIVVDMTFNTGSLHKWRTFRTALARDDYGAAADAMHRSLWRKQTGRRSKHLIQLMRSLSDG